MLDESNYIYTIDEHVVFNPKENKIINLESKKQTTIFVTCSRCLSILLDNRGSIVSQNDILEFAWPDNHRNVSYNTFYQCVLNLRKAFCQIGCKERIIITVPKKGLTIASGLTISKVEEHYVNDIDTCLNTDLVMISLVDGTDPEKNEDSLVKITIPNKNWKKYTLIILITMLVVMLISASCYYLNDNFFSHYVKYISANDNCQVYINENESSIIQNKNFIMNEKDICRDNRYIYLTIYQNAKRVSAISCKKRISYFTKNSCISYYYPAYENVHEAIK